MDKVLTFLRNLKSAADYLLDADEISHLDEAIKEAEETSEAMYDAYVFAEDGQATSAARYLWPYLRNQDQFKENALMKGVE